MSFVEGHSSRHVPWVHFQACKACSNHSSQATDHHHGAGNAKAQESKEPWQRHWHLRRWCQTKIDAKPRIHRWMLRWCQTKIDELPSRNDWVNSTDSSICYHVFSLRSGLVENVICLPALCLSVEVATSHLYDKWENSYQRGRMAESLSQLISAIIRFWPFLYATMFLIIALCKYMYTYYIYK